MNAPARYRAALDEVRARAAAASRHSIAALLDREPQRLQRLALQAAGLHLDLSKSLLSGDDLDALLDFAAAAEVPARRDAQLRGERVNATEDRPALHTALRRDPASPLWLDGRDLTADVAQALARMRAFADAVRGGAWRGASGEPIRDVVAIGIGGSALGPLLACDALREFASDGPRVHFVANIDPGAWDAVRPGLDPARTLVVVASKSWRTIETARNAQALRRWLLDGGIPAGALSRHLVGVTANPALAREFGLADEAIFPFWEWVGGRYSLWSAIGLPVMLAIGPAHFDAMLAGARAMDEHFASAPLARNAPVLLALLSAWNRLAMPGATEPVIPYCDALRRLPAYLQQLQMESNGKGVDVDGAPVPVDTMGVTWGEPGTDAQHSFFQALHQGTTAHAVEFILAIPARRDPEGRDLSLLANALAQAEALMRGRSLEDSLAELLAQGMEPERARALAMHRVHPGNRPSTTILLGALTPRSFGALLALYEHKTAVLGWLWRINSFDQWGVELGKQLATKTEAVLAGTAPVPQATDVSTRDLVARVAAALGAR
jgi:glucose-6-phosphate isomerase